MCATHVTELFVFIAVESNAIAFSLQYLVVHFIRSKIHLEKFVLNRKPLELYMDSHHTQQDRKKTVEIQYSNVAAVLILQQYRSVYWNIGGR